MYSYVHCMVCIGWPLTLRHFVSCCFMAWEKTLSSIRRFTPLHLHFAVKMFSLSACWAHSLLSVECLSFWHFSFYYVYFTRMNYYTYGVVFSGKCECEEMTIPCLLLSNHFLLIGVSHYMEVMFSCFTNKLIYLSFLTAGWLNKTF